MGKGVTKCSKHGVDYIDFKCRFCCSIALWFCFGTTHFCDPCHREAGRNKVTACAGKTVCPLGDHPPNGKEAANEYALGCGLCRSNALQHKDF
jgi:E3 ubiquitin-protein ligase MYCBP2